MRRLLRGALISITAAVLPAVSCGTQIELGETRAEDLPGGATNDAAVGTGGGSGFGGTEGSGGIDVDAGPDAIADSAPQPDGFAPFCPQLFPVWDMPLVACEVLLPQPWADIMPLYIYLGINVLYRSPLGEDRVIGYVDSEAACAGVVDGWYLVNPLDPRRIVLCPETCAAIEADGGRLYTAFGCARIRASETR
jgi:hypothetical protein